MPRRRVKRTERVPLIPHPPRNDHIKNVELPRTVGSNGLYLPHINTVIPRDSIIKVKLRNRKPRLFKNSPMTGNVDYDILLTVHDPMEWNNCIRTYTISRAFTDREVALHWISTIIH